MKKVLFYLLLTGGVFFLNGCATPGVNHSNIAPLVSFNKPSIHPYMEKIPIRVGLYLTKEFKEKMPLTDKDPEIWSWFFMEGLKPLFNDVVIIEGTLGPEKLLGFDLALKPELWHWWFLNDHAALGFKIIFFNKYGSEQFSLIAEGRSMKNLIDHWEDIRQGLGMAQAQATRERALAQAMDEMMRKFQYVVMQRKEEILSISQRNYDKK